MSERTQTSSVSWWRTSFGPGASARVATAIANEHVSQGPVTAEFERLMADVLGVPYAVASTSGSTALLMALIAAGVAPGDEVIIPNRTWIATAHAALLLGAKPVLVDVELDRPVIDVTRIEERISARTKVIMPVHLNGRSADMIAINRIAESHGLTVVEDAAQALTSRNSEGFLGTLGTMGCFSLSVAKIISTGQGGFTVTRDPELHERLRLMRTHGVSDLINASYTQMGFNFRFTDILASIGLSQLPLLDERAARLTELYGRYAEGLTALPFLEFLPVDIAAGEIPIYIEVLAPDRGRMISFLAARNIQTRPFYPDLNQAPYFGGPERFENSKRFGERGVFLPSGPDQPIENVDRVLDALYEFGKTL